MYCGFPSKKVKYETSDIKAIWELLISLNKGNCLDAKSRVDLAIEQYEQFKEKTR